MNPSAANLDEPGDPSVVLVTGAAGGLGRGLVGAFGGAGWRVAAAYHESHPFVAGTTLWPLRMDVTNRREVEDGIERVVDRWGRIDVLVHNAGVTADQLTVRMALEDWDHVLAVHLKGAFLCARAVMGPMLRRQEGHIIHISSWSGRCGQAGQANYSAAKAGLLGWTAALAKEVGASNVRVNAILPGALPTRMTARLEAGVREELIAANVLGRSSTIEEVSTFVRFLAGMRHVSGQVFQLDSRVGRWG